VEVKAVGDLPDFLTVPEAARVLRIGRTTAYKEAKRFLATGGREGIPVCAVGGLLRIPRVRLEQLAGGPLRLPPLPRPEPNLTVLVACHPKYASTGASSMTAELPFDVS